MKICVFGAGAIGGHMAVQLARAGAEISVLVRGRTLAAIRARGLELRTPEGVVRAQVRATDDPRELGIQDAVLVTLKSTALASAAPQIAVLLGTDTPAVFLQNGIPWWYFHGVGGEHEGRQLAALDPCGALWRSVGPRRAVGGVTSSPCTVVEPGVVLASGGNLPVTLGEPDGTLSPRVERLAAAFRAASFPVDATARIRAAVWHKLALNLASGPLAVLAPVPLAALYAEPACVSARMTLLGEVEAIAAAMGCPIEASRSMDFVLNSPHVPSIGQDVAAGRRPEVEALFLAPLAMAREKGVPAPMLELLVALSTLRLRAAGLYP